MKITVNTLAVFKAHPITFQHQYISYYFSDNTKTFPSSSKPKSAKMLNNKQRKSEKKLTAQDYVNQYGQINFVQKGKQWKSPNVFRFAARPLSHRESPNLMGLQEMYDVNAPNATPNLTKILDESDSELENAIAIQKIMKKHNVSHETASKLHAHQQQVEKMNQESTALFNTLAKEVHPCSNLERIKAVAKTAGLTDLSDQELSNLFVKAHEDETPTTTSENSAVTTPATSEYNVPAREMPTDLGELLKSAEPKKPFFEDITAPPTPVVTAQFTLEDNEETARALDTLEQVLAQTVATMPDEDFSGFFPAISKRQAKRKGVKTYTGTLHAATDNDHRSRATPSPRPYDRPAPSATVTSATVTRDDESATMDNNFAAPEETTTPVPSAPAPPAPAPPAPTSASKVLSRLSVAQHNNYGPSEFTTASHLCNPEVQSQDLNTGGTLRPILLALHNMQIHEPCKDSAKWIKKIRGISRNPSSLPLTINKKWTLMHVLNNTPSFHFINTEEEEQRHAPALLAATELTRSVVVNFNQDVEGDLVDEFFAVQAGDAVSVERLHTFFMSVLTPTGPVFYMTRRGEGQKLLHIPDVFRQILANQKIVKIGVAITEETSPKLAKLGLTIDPVINVQDFIRVHKRYINRVRLTNTNARYRPKIDLCFALNGFVRDQHNLVKSDKPGVIKSVTLQNYIGQHTAIHQAVTKVICNFDLPRTTVECSYDPATLLARIYSPASAIRSGTNFLHNHQPDANRAFLHGFFHQPTTKQPSEEYPNARKLTCAEAAMLLEPFNDRHWF